MIELFVLFFATKFSFLALIPFIVNALFLNKLNVLKSYISLSLFLLFTVYGCADEKDVSKKKEALETQVPVITYPLVSLTNSTDIKDILCQNWDNSEDLEDASTSGGSDLGLTFRGLSFFTDGSVMKDPHGYFDVGTWQLHADKKPVSLELKLSKGKEVYLLGSLNPKKMRLLQEGSTKTISYTGNGFRPKNLADDPFYPANNYWRLKPTKPESEEQLKKRLKDCIHFYCLYYDYNIFSDAKVISFSGFPGCFKWYAGGIHLKKEKDLTDDWINCFYNKEQAQQCYKYADKLISKKYIWPKAEKRWMRQNVYVLRQMENKVDSL